MKNTLDIHKLTLTAFSTNCYIVVAENQNTAIIDPADNAELILEYLKENGFTLKKILLTHGHRDHTDACQELVTETGAALYINTADYGMISDYSKSIPLGYRPKSFRAVKNYVPVNNGDMIEMDEIVFEALHTPGHTMGGMCYITGDVMFSGDTLFAGTIGNTSFDTGDVELMKQSLKRLSLLDYNYRVLPGHGESTLLDYEKETNPYFNRDWVD